ncbi:mercuric reductase [Candidatus Aerophobetes bacterium]|uniref:Mercuric reductase n=1 Tax=Aerophobetes bacterium TaxID=2030807 RepID=A0A2A4YKN7_UNCAE|nr:MAG: mercuric reductase [Candidatus Aerophobetes bacterium]
MKYYTIVIGSGAAGLVVAMGLAKANKKVLLIEKGHFGGDCTNYGCIPSKSLIASANAAHTLKKADSFGLKIEGSLDTSGVFSRVQGIIERIRSHEDEKALTNLGIDVCIGEAKFKDAKTIEVDGKGSFTANYILIATGSKANIPNISGLQNTPFLTNETIFSLKNVPASMTFLGGGPIGCELAMAFARLGTKVSLIHKKKGLLDKECEEAQKTLEEVFIKEGIDLHLNSSIKEVTHSTEGFSIKISSSEESQIASKELMISIGRSPNIHELNLKNADIKYKDSGIIVDAYGRTNIKHIFAAGDAIGPPFFTHFAENQARAILTTLLLPFSKKRSSQYLPRVTFTDPEVASFGMSYKDALNSYREKSIAVYRVKLKGIDRAVTNGTETGFVEIVTKRLSSKILGATIVAKGAGEMVQELLVASYTKTPLRKLASIIHPYPTMSLAIRKAADLWLTETLIPFIKNPFKFL